VTVLEAIQKSADFLAKRGVDSPRLQAELLLAHRLKMPRMKLYLNFDRALSAEDTDTYRELIKRRSQREPLQHIIGSTSFCGYEITVNRYALVPRPETEILAESGWTFLSTLNSANALDVGTGTGCIAIALAAKCPNTKISATDISPDALALAKENATRNNVQIEFLQSDSFTALPPDTRFDLIISNPPYIPTAEIETLAERVRPAIARRLEERLVDLLKGVQLDPIRLAQEAALLAERSDVSEELARLRSHVEQFRKLLAGAGEAGKKLDFLLQEMQREANTLLSKTPGVESEGLAITELALEVKSDIEKLREQAQNVE